jgi:DNA topoisomerase I
VAATARIRRVDCSTPGLGRLRRGRGFVYLDLDGRPIRDPEQTASLKALTIPPAWKEVWICPDAAGHLQAVGTDAAGRRQYLYHPRWRARRDAEKFDHMLEFARALPRLREQVAESLAGGGGGRTHDRVLACAVRLLDRGFFRIGTEGYAEQNQTYGLATMHRRHVRVDGREITFDYPSKGGRRHLASIVDPEVAAMVAALKRRRGGGPELLAYRQGDRWVDVRSEDINAWIRERTGGDFTAKDFRTWSATVLAAVALSASWKAARSRTARTRAVRRAVEEVAHYLGNTPAVTRASYIDPRVFDRFRSGLDIAGTLEQLGDVEEFGMPAHQGPVEAAVLDLIEERRAPDFELIV